MPSPGKFLSTASLASVSTTRTGTAWCTICCEDDKPSSERVILSFCRHESCKECMVKWIEKEAEAKSLPAPTCPFCRLDLAEEDTLAILGRPFRPVPANSTDRQTSLVEQEIDDLTLDWLRAQTRACPTCGARIEKVEGGCDKMECLCGCRFCYACGSPHAQCSCTPLRHHFWDNHRNKQSHRHVTPLHAPRDDETGLVDLRRHIKDQARRARTERVQLERRSRKDEVEREASMLYQWNPTYSNTCTWNGTWIFCSPSQTVSTRVLLQKLRGNTVREWRALRRRRGCGPETVRQSQLSNYITSGQWIFPRTNRHATSGVNRWLSRLLRRQMLESRVRRRRLGNRRTASEEVFRMNDLSANWLFEARTNLLSTYMLTRQMLGGHVRKDRRSRRQSLAEENKEISSSKYLNDVLLSSGQWLFARDTPSKTCKLVDRLVHQQLAASRLRQCQFLR